MNIDKLIHKNDELFDELEFWKSVAIEHYVPEDAYEEFCRDVESMQYEMDFSVLQGRYTDEC